MSRVAEKSIREEILGVKPFSTTLPSFDFIDLVVDMLKQYADKVSIGDTSYKVLKSLIFGLFLSKRSYKVLFLGYFCPKDVIKSHFCLKRKFQN